MLKLVLLMLITFLSSHVYAMFFSSYIYEMGAEQNFIAKSVMNNTDQFNNYKVRIVKIDLPGKNGENVIYQKDRELLFSPLSLNIPAGKTDYFKLVYIGPKDDQERYYRVIFEENRIKAYDKLNNKDASSQFIPAVSLSTIFIVQPRKQNLKYNFDEQKGYLKNTGNTTFRVIVSQGCEGSDEDATQFYMLPGEEYHNESLKGENRKFLVANKKYIPIGTTCMVE